MRSFGASDFAPSVGDADLGRAMMSGLLRHRRRKGMGLSYTWVN